MSGAHTELGPELRKLAQTVLDGIDPAVRAAAAMASAAGVGKCQQVWCPVCALAALVAGEQHPLLTVVADHSVALLDVIRAIVADIDKSGDQSEKPPPDGPPTGGLPTEGTNGDGAAKTRYQAIPITLQE